MLAIGLLFISYSFLKDANIPVLNPKGIIGEKERQLLFIGVGLSLLVVVPVFTMTIFIVWKYRETNKKATYTPEWDHSRKAETIWWLIPTILIAIISIITWKSSYALDPYRQVASTNKPLNVKVVSLDWKWLFIYPKENIATVNYLVLPVNRPVTFDVTSDAPMNSFWIPQLGGQIYAMPGMSTQLNLMATSVGTFRGLSANISGSGFSSMNFVVKSTSGNDFDSWVSGVKKSSLSLNDASYRQLQNPSENYPATYYSSEQAGLYDTIVYKYMMPIAGTKTQ